MKTICHHLIPFFTFLILWAATTSAQKQGRKLFDSLLTELPKTKEDTNKVNILNAIGRTTNTISEYDRTIVFSNDAITLSEKLNFKKGKANAINNIGIALANKGDYIAALDNYNMAIKLYEEIGNKRGVAGAYNNIGLIHQHQGNFPETLKMLLKALKINEEIGNKVWIAANLNNIGIIHIYQKNYSEALKNLTAANKILEELGDRRGMNHPYNNMGNIYFELGNYPEALKNYTEALKIREEMGDKNLIADSYSNIGIIYEKQKKYNDALDRYFASLKIKEEIGDRDGMSTAYLNIGNTKMSMKNYSDARYFMNKSLVINKEVGNIDGIQNCYGSLAELDSATGNHKGSLENYKSYIIFRDSLYNEDNTKKLVATQMQYDFDKKESATKAEQDKKDAIAKEKIKQQRNIRNFSLTGVAALLLFLIVVVRQRNRVRKEKQRSDELLLNILPAETAEELKATGTAVARDFEEVTVLFTDFKDFTQASEKMTAHELVNEIHYYFSEFDKIISKHNIEKIKTIGDSYMAAGGLPTANKTNAIDTVTAALEIQSFMDQKKKQNQKENKIFFDIRIGVNTGPVIAGIVGIKKFAYDIWGDTVNIASRMESSGQEGKVNVSGATYELVKDKFNCTYRGKVMAKHKGEIDMYFVEA
jgi:adenylate cyclase